MANSVDTMIDSAVQNARSWGDQTDTDVWRAINGINFAPKAGTTSLQSPTIRTSPSPPPAAGFGAGGVSAGTQDATMQQLSNELNAFFLTYFSPADAYSAAEMWMLNTLTTNDPHLPGTNFDLIWGRAQDDTLALGNDLVGLPLPAEALTPHVTLGVQAFTHAEAYARSAAKVALWAHAVTIGLKDLRASAIEAVGKYIRARLQMGADSARAAIVVAEARASLKISAADWYAMTVEPMSLNTQVDMIKAKVGRVDELVKAENLANLTQLRVSAAIQGADKVAQVAQAAASSRNAVVGSSSASFPEP